MAEICLVACEDDVGPAAFRGAELECILEVSQSKRDRVQRIGVADICDEADAKKLTDELKSLLPAAIPAQDVEEV